MQKCSDISRFGYCLGHSMCLLFDSGAENPGSYHRPEFLYNSRPQLKPDCTPLMGLISS